MTWYTRSKGISKRHVKLWFQFSLFRSHSSAVRTGKFELHYSEWQKPDTWHLTYSTLSSRKDLKYQKISWREYSTLCLDTIDVRKHGFPVLDPRDDSFKILKSISGNRHIGKSLTRFWEPIFRKNGASKYKQVLVFCIGAGFIDPLV